MPGLHIQEHWKINSNFFYESVYESSVSRMAQPLLRIKTDKKKKIQKGKRTKDKKKKDDK